MLNRCVARHARCSSAAMSSSETAVRYSNAGCSFAIFDTMARVSLEPSASITTISLPARAPDIRTISDLSVPSMVGAASLTTKTKHSGLSDSFLYLREFPIFTIATSSAASEAATMIIHVVHIPYRPRCMICMHRIRRNSFAEQKSGDAEIHSAPPYHGVRVMVIYFERPKRFVSVPLSFYLELL